VLGEGKAVEVARCGSARWVLELMKPSCRVVQLPAEMDPLQVPPGQGAEITLRSRQGQHLTFGIVESAMQVRLLSFSFLFSYPLALLLGACYLERGSSSWWVSRVEEVGRGKGCEMRGR
jgi:hypothetical protein